MKRKSNMAIKVYLSKEWWADRMGREPRAADVGAVDELAKAAERHPAFREKYRFAVGPMIAELPADVEAWLDTATAMEEILKKGATAAADAQPAGKPKAPRRPRTKRDTPAD
jgi:hypothetical protein